MQLLFGGGLQVRRRSPAEPGGASARHQCPTLWAAVDKSQPVGANVRAECARIDTTFQHPSGVNAGQPIGSRIEGV
jgi:hypothetical protein